MKQGTTYYDLLAVSQHADRAAISAAYRQVSNALATGQGALSESDTELQQQLLKQAYEVLSTPSRRADYDAGLAMRGEVPSLLDVQLRTEAANESAKWSPIRRLLTIIASLMVVGMVMQMAVMFMAYQRSRAMADVDATSPVAEKAYLQDFYQTYGIRAASRAEADLLLADMRRKEQAARDEVQRQRQEEEAALKLKRFEEESRRLGAEVTANNLRAEQEAERLKAEEIRQKEEAERAVKEAELARREQEINRFRSRPSQYGE